MARMPGFLFLASMVTALLAYGARAFSNGVILGSLLASAALTWTGVTTHQDWLISLGVLLGSVLVGVAVGRVIPPRSTSILLILGILSVADIIWIATGGGSASGWVEGVANLTVQTGAGSSSIGTVDLVLAAVITTHWLQRDAGIGLAIAAPPIGMVASNVYVAVSGADNLPLVPFITLGWLLTEAWHRRSTRPQRQSG